VIAVRVAEAAKLSDGDFFGRDPYVIVEVGGQVQQTEIEANTNSPHWHNANFEFSVYKSSDPSARIVMFKVYDHKLVSDDEIIGWAAYNITPCIAMPERTKLTPDL